MEWTISNILLWGYQNSLRLNRTWHKESHPLWQPCIKRFPAEIFELAHARPRWLISEVGRFGRSASADTSGHMKAEHVQECWISYTHPPWLLLSYGVLHRLRLKLPVYQLSHVCTSRWTRLYPPLFRRDATQRVEVKDAGLLILLNSRLSE